MKKITKMILSLGLISVLMLGLVGCNTGNKTNSGVNGGTSQEELADTQHIDKATLGISMDLTGEYQDCVVKDIEKEELNSILEGAYGGFSINKTIGEKEVLLANVVLAKNDVLGEPEVRSMFPFQFSGNMYSVVASVPLSDTTSPDYETINTLQSNIVSTQLVTLFLDESVLPGGTGGGTEESLEGVNNEESDNVDAITNEENTSTSGDTTNEENTIENREELESSSVENSEETAASEDITE